MAAVDRALGSLGLGGSSATDKEQRSIQSLNPKVLGHLRHLFDTRARPEHTWRRTDARTFIDRVQQGEASTAAATALLEQTRVSLDDFLCYMTSPDSSLVRPLKENDLSRPLSSYFINSSHNTYLTGNQFSSDSTTEAYTDVLMQGCRCVEIDVWNGVETTSEGSRSSTGTDDHSRDDDFATDVFEPRVLHGYTLTKDVPFRDVCRAIGESAFAVTDLPLIVSLEVHCNPAQQVLMVDIMQGTWRGLLVSAPETGVESLPSPDALRGKILVKVKHVPAHATAADESEDSGSGISDSDDEVGMSTAPTPRNRHRRRASKERTKARRRPAKTIRQLSRLGVYTQAVSFKAWTQPEATMATHIFSLSEGKFLEHSAKARTTLAAHNQNFLVRVYPSGLCISSSNLYPPIFWAAGAQFVALNWQQLDKGYMLNHAMFADSGGFVLKPQCLLGPPEPPCRQTLSLAVRFLVAQALPLPLGDSSACGFRPYVKMELHVDGATAALTSDGDDCCKARTVTHRGRDIDFARERLVLAASALAPFEPALAFVRFTVRDDELGRDDLAAWACVRLDRLARGVCFLRLRDAAGAPSAGLLLVEMDWALTPDAERP